MSYFNMIQLIESSGIGLVYGLRFYSKGQLDNKDIVSYVKTNALLYEYYKQAYEQMPIDIGDELVRLFNSEAFIVVNTRYSILFTSFYDAENQGSWYCFFKKCISLQHCSDPSQCGKEWGQQKSKEIL